MSPAKKVFGSLEFIREMLIAELRIWASLVNNSTQVIIHRRALVLKTRGLESTSDSFLKLARDLGVAISPLMIDTLVRRALEIRSVMTDEAFDSATYLAAIGYLEDGRKREN